MRRHKLLLITALALLFVSHLALADGKPRLQFDKTFLDLGVFTRVPQVSGIFTFRNSGDAELKLITIKPSCACMRTYTTPLTLAPGESGTMEFSINIGPSVGDIAEQIYVSSTDPAQPNITLHIKCYINPTFMAEPTVLLFGELPPGATGTATTIIRRTDGQKLRITDISYKNLPTSVFASKDPCISTEIQFVRDSKEQAARLIVHYRAGRETGLREDSLTIYTGEEYYEGFPRPSLVIPVRAIVTPPPKEIKSPRK